MERPTLSDLRRFERYVHPEPNSGCWLWSGAANEHGYGNFSYGGRKNRTVASAHRFAHFVYKFHPFWMQVLHRCDNPSCVNPDHLFLGTTTDNMRDMVRKGRHLLNNRPLANSLKTTCHRGHPLSGPNLYARNDGSRVCRECRRINARNRSLRA